MQRFQVEVLRATSNPQQAIYLAMHQDYSEAWVYGERDRWPDEAKCGELITKNLLAGNRGHYGPLEHPQIILNCGWFPHSTMQQIRTHRVGVSFDVQCLAGDTEITFVKASGSLRKIRIADLYDLWANGEKAVRTRNVRGRNGEPPGEYRRDCKNRLKKMSLRVLNEETGIFETSHIQHIFNQGMQPVYRLTLEDGRTLDCTENHQLFTAEGWSRMGEALELLTNADGEVLSFKQDCHLMTNGVVVGERPKLEFAQNLMPITELLPKPKPQGRKLKAHPMKVVQVKYLGRQQTYDIEVAGRWHNFVANGVVVHNSFRYTGQRIIDVVEGKRDVEDVFYLRPVGFYTDRQGKRYEYTEELRRQDLEWCFAGCERYKLRIDQGFSEEHARSLIPFDVRQHWVMSANVRSLMHLIDLRWKADAQLEAQKLCELIWPHFQAWVPAIADWYETNRLKKARLAP
ncbi:MAG: FAD-dependent thymidylate synthase [Trichocoleus desertorum ATA4-8-CV12]|jgi:thymidylate synthase (FAD)|nr:FAD-dependent thymidylate synthase [Trichocoleus desertorum ATA4-8-CV12]